MLFALVDCNNFYVSCERVFDARLRHRAVIVLSNNDGCVVARSNEAKKLGIKMGIPVFQVRNIIDANQIKVLSSNYPLYGDMSRRVMNALSEFSSHMEIYSVDEAFLEIEESPRAGELDSFGRNLKASIYRQTGIPVSVGVAATKTLAKLANYLAKESSKAGGVLDLSNSMHLDRALERTPVEEVWGIGSQSAKLLKANQIETALEFRNADPAWVEQQLTISGRHVLQELLGIPCIRFHATVPIRKSMTVSRSFGSQIHELKDMRAAVAQFLTRAGEKLRRNALSASVLTIFVATNRFAKQSPQYSNSIKVKLSLSTNQTSELIEHGMPALESIFREGYSYKKAGITLTGIVQSAEVNRDLLDNRRSSRSCQLSDTLDRINRLYGQDLVHYGVVRKHRHWRPKSEQRSPQYTTDWGELFTVS